MFDSYRLLVIRSGPSLYAAIVKLSKQLAVSQSVGELVKVRDRRSQVRRILLDAGGSQRHIERSDGQKLEHAYLACAVEERLVVYLTIELVMPRQVARQIGVELLVDRDMLTQLFGVDMDAGSRQRQFLTGVNFPLLSLLGNQVRNVRLDSVSSSEHYFLNVRILHNAS